MDYRQQLQDEYARNIEEQIASAHEHIANLDIELREKVSLWNEFALVVSAVIEEQSKEGL